MKNWKKLLFSVLIGGMLSVIKCEAGLAEIKEAYPNRFAVGLNLFQGDLDMNMRHVKVDGNEGFSGICFGYEYRKPESIYILVDVAIAGSNNKFHVHEEGLNGERALHLDFINSSILLGYTKSYCNWLLTPYFGFGGVDICNETTRHPKIRQHSGFVIAGFKCDYSFNDYFDAGANFQLFSNCGTKEYRIEKLSDSSSIVIRSDFNTFGLSVSLPITYHYGCALQWDVKLEPYYTVISFEETQRLYGAILAIGYNF